MKSTAVAKTNAKPILSNVSKVAQEFTAQFQRAVSGSREVLIFGAFYMSLQVVLERQNNPHGPQTKGEGLKGFIEAYCPLINYKTAYDMYTFAKSARAALAIPPTTNIYELLTADVDSLSKREQKIRREIDDAIEGKSVRACMTGWGFRKARAALPPSGGAREGAGRKPRSLEREQVEIDAFFSPEALGAFSSAVLEKRWHLRLDDERKSVLLAAAERLVADLGGKQP